MTFLWYYLDLLGDRCVWTTLPWGAPARAPAAAGEILPDRVQSSDDSSAPAAGREDSKKTKEHKGKNDGKEKESGKKQKKDKRAKKDKEEEDKDLPDADHRPVGAGRGGDDDDDDLFDGLEGLDEMMSGSEADDNQKGGAKKKPASTRGKGGTKKRPSKKAADMEACPVILISKLTFFQLKTICRDTNQIYTEFVWNSWHWHRFQRWSPSPMWLKTATPPTGCNA